jgi:hypothetical protein
MRAAVRRTAAGLALLTLLACSSLGTCWVRLAASTRHHCCAQGPAVQAQAKPCGSTAVSTPTVALAAPSDASQPLPHLDVRTNLAPRAGTFGPADHVLDPPLVLRI